MNTISFNHGLWTQNMHMINTSEISIQIWQNAVNSWLHNRIVTSTRLVTSASKTRSIMKSKSLLLDRWAYRRSATAASDPNTWTSCSSYASILRFIMSMHGPRTRSNAATSNTETHKSSRSEMIIPVYQSHANAIVKQHRLQSEQSSLALFWHPKG